jgi:hypothetical protein
MKRLSSIAAIALFAVAFTSCKKDYTCECTTTQNGTVMSSSELPMGKTTKKKAKDACNALDEEITLFGASAMVNCEIK